MKSMLNIRVDIAPFLFFISIVYIEIISPKWWSASNVYTALLLLTVFALFLLYHRDFLYVIRYSRIIHLYFVFILLSIFSVFMFAPDRVTGIQSLTRQFEYMLLAISVYTFTRHNGNIKFILKILAGVGIFVGLLLVFQPVLYSEGINRTIYFSYAASVNPHDAAMMAVIGAWAVLYLVSHSRVTAMKAMLSLYSLCFFMYAIFQTNSRKSFLAIIILVIFALPQFLKYIKSSLNKQQRILMAFGVILMGIIVAQWVVQTDLLSQNNFIERLQNLSDDSNLDRVNLIKDGFTVFLDHPIMGVGLNNYRNYSPYGTYTHNTFAELFSCSGLLGAIPFMAMYCYVAVKLIRTKIGDDLFLYRYRKRMIMVLFFIIVFISMSQIIFYARELFVAFFVVSAILECSAMAQTNEHKKVKQ